MKKILTLCFIFLIAFVLLGCNNESDKVIVTFKINDFSSVVEIKKGMNLTDDIIPNCQSTNIKLYYDKDYLKEYNNEPIDKNIDIYIKICNEDKDNMVDKVCEAYFNKFVKPKRENAVLEDVLLYEYLGVYNGNFVGVFLDKKDSIFIEVVCEITVEDVVFTYSYGYDIYVYDGTNFMDLLTAYNESKLTYEDILEIYKIYYKK